MGHQEPTQEIPQQRSGDYAPYPIPSVQQDYPDATPGIPAGQPWGTQVMGNPANPSSHPDNSAAARGLGPGSSGYSSSGGFQPAPQTFAGSGSGVGSQGGYVSNPTPQGKGEQLLAGCNFCCLRTI